MRDLNESSNERRELLVSEPAKGVLRVTLNRPERLNALTSEVLAELSTVLDAVAKDSVTRVVILNGAGTSFCAGFDLDEIAQTQEMGLPELLRNQERWAAAVQRIVDLPVPVIAAIDGAAVGAGMSLALAADLRVVTHKAKFGAAFVRIGLSGADLGLSWSLPRVVGMGVAAELMLTGRNVDAAEAYRIGLANRLCPDHDLQSAAMDLAAEISANSPFGVRLTKQALHAGVDASSFRVAVDMENRNQLLASRTEDMAEVMRARWERRPPRYRNA
ncbi:enoyl-CoA hydratase/isomerase family protein [Nocardia neocaledoniensis]|uniref:enoyl-CoA hydratase/isomerase family protein n=1 Tax=Nocardia neocaledoniensis TaxID=236511 RepID=UPI0024552D83|nr:enoyl-CoA hydratase-related protein [Nocardia neocaledoniensis]